MIKRYNTISVLPDVMSLVDYDIPKEEVGEYQVDTTHFVPRCEAEAVPIVSAGDPSMQGMYDFADGRDTGGRVPFNRSHGYTGDIAEVSVAVREAQADAKSNLDKSYQEYQAQQALDALTGSSSETSNQGQSN